MQRKIRLTRRCEELSGEELRFSPGEWLWFTVTERTATGLWAEYEGYRAFLSDTDAGFRENESPSQRYGPGQLVRMRVTGIDEKANALTVSAELVSDYSQFDSCTVGTVDVAEVIHVAVKAITVCFRGIYCRVPLERASLFPIANAKMLYAVREQLTMVVEAADPETRTLKLSVQQRYNDWSEIRCGRATGFGRNLLPVAALRTVAARRRSFLPGVRREPFLAAGDRACALPDRLALRGGRRGTHRPRCADDLRLDRNPRRDRPVRAGPAPQRRHRESHGGRRRPRPVCVLRCGELYLSMPREEVLPGHAPECGDEVKVRVLSVDKVKRTFYVSQRAVTHDPLLTFSVGQKAEGTVQSLFGTMCLVRVNGLVGTLPVSEAQIKAMNIRSDANHNGLRFRHPFHEAADHILTHAHDQQRSGRRLPRAVHRSQGHGAPCVLHVPQTGQALRRGDPVLGVLLEPPDRRAVPAGRPDQRRHHGRRDHRQDKVHDAQRLRADPNPLLTCETGDTLPCTVLGTTAGGYLMRCGGAVGFLHCSEIMWQYCDQWHGVWKRGEKVSCRILHLSPAEGGLLLGHRQTVGDPFLKHTPGVGSGYPATVRRSSDESVVVLLGDTGSKPRSPRPT